MFRDTTGFEHPSAPRTIQLAEVLGAFSYALDLTEGQPEGHCIRACWIGSEIGQQLGLAEDAMHELFYTILLKDLGCSSNAARISELYLTDDRAFKRDFKLVGSGLPEMLRFVFSRTGPTAALWPRAKAVANILRNGPAIAGQLILSRCERGADIARRLRFSESTAQGIYSLDEHWDGSGKPHSLQGDAIPLFSRIALLCQVAEIFHANGGPASAIAEIQARSGSWFDPAIATAFGAVSADPGFWGKLESPALERQLLASAGTDRTFTVDEDYLDDIAAAFGAVVDAKSPYTGGHSSRVAHYADRVAETIGYEPSRRRWLRRGALLHDIGKLGVSNSILDKPAKLDKDEWALMQAHAGNTGSILSRISAFEDLAPLAAAHHERLDGTGYPLGLQSQEISIETRVITVCDFFDALTADRPYRVAMAVPEAMAIIEANIGVAIDRDCFHALRSTLASGLMPAESA